MLELLFHEVLQFVERLDAEGLSDIKEVGASPADTEDLINLTLAVKGTQVAAIMIEQPDKRVKLS